MPTATVDDPEPDSPDHLRINKDQYLKQEAERKDLQVTLEQMEHGSAHELASIETEHFRGGSSAKPEIVSSKGNTTRNNIELTNQNNKVMYSSIQQKNFILQPQGIIDVKDNIKSPKTKDTVRPSSTLKKKELLTQSKDGTKGLITGPSLLSSPPIGMDETTGHKSMINSN